MEWRPAGARTRRRRPAGKGAEAMSEKCAEPCAGLARLERRVDDLQRQVGGDHKELRDRLAEVETTNAVQNAKYDAIIEKLDGLTRRHDGLVNKLETLEAKPGKRWEALAEKSVWAVCAAVISWLLRGAGL